MHHTDKLVQLANTDELALGGIKPKKVKDVDGILKYAHLTIAALQKRAETFAVLISPSSSSIVIAVIAPCGTSSSRSQLKNDGLSKLKVATPFSPSLDLRGAGVSQWRVRCVDAASPPRQLDVGHVRLVQTVVETDAGARFH